MVNVDDLDDELRGLIKPELAPGERLLWAARGTPRYGAPGWVWGIVWALGFGGICILLISLSAQPRFRTFENALVLFGLFAGIISFLVALAAIQNGFAWGFEGRNLRKTVYALTDQRVILWRLSRTRRGSKSFPTSRVNF